MSERFSIPGDVSISGNVNTSGCISTYQGTSTYQHTSTYQCMLAGISEHVGTHIRAHWHRHKGHVDRQHIKARWQTYKGTSADI
jgi:hypothetical protein